MTYANTTWTRENHLRVEHAGSYDRGVVIPAPNEDASPRQLLDFLALRELRGVPMELAGRAVDAYLETYGVRPVREWVVGGRY